MAERIYELMYLASPDLNDAGVEALRAEVDSLIATSGGSIREFLFLTKRRLAYPVQSFASAYVACERIMATPEATAVIAKALKRNANIIRYNFTCVTEKIIQRFRAPKPITSAAKERGKAAAIKPTYTKLQAAPGEEKKVDIVEIEKKLDEILGREF